MTIQQDLGKKGEQIALDHLTEKDYKILKRNWYFRKKEIDIIAEKDDFLVIIEVKSRSVGFQENPRDAVNMKKQRFLIQAANAYVNKYNIDLEVRFDIITVVFLNDQEYEIEHIDDAFYPTLRH
ncbi:MAG: YraN family protein [Bacteroidales bacterium]|nr:YraN family protein [Bacteroidales bacterium]